MAIFPTSSTFRVELLWNKNVILDGDDGGSDGGGGGGGDSSGGSVGGGGGGVEDGGGSGGISDSDIISITLFY